jgi:hypothetical protein
MRSTLGALLNVDRSRSKRLERHPMSRALRQRAPVNYDTSLSSANMSPAWLQVRSPRCPAPAGAAKGFDLEHWKRRGYRLPKQAPPAFNGTLVSGRVFVYSKPASHWS